jgi:hypothetical protein
MVMMQLLVLVSVLHLQDTTSVCLLEKDGLYKAFEFVRY